MSTGGQQPTSFKTNVNRAKTKRWVEAKSYTYDGDDWGDADEYDEYGGYDEPPTPPKPTGLRQQGQSAGSISQSPYGSPTTPQQRWNETAGPDHGNVAAQTQQKYGLRSSTNPPPRGNQELGRSASFDRGDEKRAFSAGAYQPGNINSAASTSQQPYSTVNVQSPTQFNPNQMRQVQPDQRQIPQQRDQSRAESLDAYSSSGNYRGPYSYDEPRQAAAGNRTQSITSTTPSVDVYNRRDYTPPALPPPLNSQNSPPLVSGPVSQRPPRSSSLSQTTQPSIYNAPQGPGEALSEAALPQRERTSSNAEKPLPLIRPADIYRRMHEEKERERQSQESTRPSIDAVTSKAEDQITTTHSDLQEEELRYQGLPTGVMLIPSHQSTETGVLKEESVQSSHSGATIQGERGTIEDPHIDRQQTTSPIIASTSKQSSLLPMLPEVARMSAFGESFLGTSNEDDRAEAETDMPPASHQPSVGPTTVADGSITDLQHQPSSGFRSVVNQAFDITDDQIPPTPSTTAGSGIERSTSGGTSVISPIISRGPSTSKPESKLKDAAKQPLTTPVPEEVESPAESDAAFADYHEPGPAPFIPGHRRDLSTPSPGNSPARTPAVESNRQIRQPQEAEMAIASPIEPDDGSRKSPTKEADRVRGESPFSFNARNRNDTFNQSKVRDLAGKFESASSSRRGSDQSPTRRTGQLALTSQNKDSAAPTRPQGDRMESFRPRLPGGWESYASNAPLAASNRSLDIERRGPDSRQDNVNLFPQRSDDTGANSEIESPDTPTQGQHTEGKRESQNDPFSSVKAAGMALAGAFASVTGADPSASGESAGTGTNPARYLPNEPASKPRSRGTSINTNIHPEAARPPLPLASDDDDVSSVAPTPPLKNSQTLSKTTDSAEYFQHATIPDSSEVNDGSQQPTSVSRPPIPPHLSTDLGSHYESDRLRREIMRDLTPDVPSEPTTAESDSPYQDEPRLPASRTSQPQSAARESIVLPKEYESYWNGPSRQSLSQSSSGHDRISASLGLQEAPTTATMSEDPSTQSVDDPQVDLTSKRGDLLGIRPSLEPHRFSWEPSSPNQVPTVETAQEPIPNSPPLQSSYPQGHGPIESENADKEALQVSPREFPDSPTVKDPFGIESVDVRSREFGGLQAGTTSHKPTLPAVFGDRQASGFSSEKQSIPDSTETREFSRGRTPAEAMPQDETEELYEHSTLASSIAPKTDEPSSSIPAPSVQTSFQSKIPAFREILALKTPAERIRCFSEAREHFANTESDLRSWLTAMTNALPEHADVLANVGRPPAAIMGHKPSTSRLLSGLRSTGSPRPGISASDTGNSFSQGSSPLAGGSKISSHQVQAKSKDLLHSAGVFGGKANVAAKEFFSKGRSRLKEARGSDKDITPPSSPASMPSEMQPQDQPPFVQSMRRVSFDTSTVASEQPGYYRDGYQNRFEPVQQVADHTTLDVGGGSLSDSQEDHLEHSPRHTRDNHEDQPAKPSNLQSPIDYSLLSQAHGSILPDESGHGRDLASPSGNFPRRDSGRNRGPDSQEHANKKSLQNQPSARRYSPKEHTDSSAKENLPWATAPSTSHSRFDPLQENIKGMTIRLDPENSLSQPIKTERTSEDSNGTFHTAENAVRSRPGSAMVEESPETPKAKQSQPSSSEDAIFFNREDPSSTPILQSTTDGPTAQVQEREPSTDDLARSENDPYKPSPTTFDYLAREPSLDNIVSRISSDRSPSPVSPQHSIHNEPVRQQSTREPIYYGPQHDFDVKQTRNSALRHPGSSSLSGEVSGVSERPAFPQPSPNENQASKRIDTNVHTGRATGSYAEEQASPAINNTSERRSRSNRTSRNSVFFKNLGGSGTVGVPSIVSAVETQQQAPSYNKTTATESEKKSKRGSLFRSRPSDKSDDDTRGIASSSATGSVAPMDIWGQASPSTSKSSQLDGSLNSDSIKSRSKLNRASTSGNKVNEEGGKKKRFSAIGSIFGKRSSRNQPSPAIQARYVQAGPSDNSGAPPQPQYQTSYSPHVSSVDQRRPQPEFRQSQAQVDTSGSQRAEYSSPSRSDTIASQASTPVWSQAAQRVSQPRQPSYKEPSAYVQDSSLRQQATSPSNAIRPGPVRNSTSVSRSTPSDTPTTKTRTSLFSRSKSRESSTTGRNRDSPGKTWITSKDRDRQDRTGGSSGRQSLPVQATREPQRVLTFSQFGESHIDNNLDQQQQPSQNQSSDRQSHSSFNPHPQRTTSLGNNLQSRAPPRILTFNQFGENHIVESPSQRQLIHSSPQNKATQAQQPTVVTFQQFPSDPKSLPSQSSGRESPPPPPPPPKDDWHVSKARSSASQSIQADSSQQYGDTISRTSAPTAHSNHKPRSTSQPRPQPQAQAQQRQAPPPIQTEIPSGRLSTFNPASDSAESRKARQRELESVSPSTEKEMASVPARNDASSEEKIVMSSSSYPGQEWQPSFAYDD